MRRFALLLVLPGLALAAQDDPATFRTKVRVVNVPCTVRDRQGKYVSNLTQADFVVREDGVEQKVSYFAAPQDDPITITLLLDTNQPDLDFLRAEKNAAIQFFLSPLGKFESAALMRFDHDFWVVQDFTDSATLLLSAARSLAEHGAAADPSLEHRVSLKGAAGSGVVQSGRNAQLYEAISRAARSMGERQGRKALIVVTDWSDLGTRLRLEDVFEAVENSSTILYPILLAEPRTPDAGGHAEALLKALLRKLARDTGGRDLEVDLDHPLGALLEQIRQELRAQYLLGYTPSGSTTGNGYREIEVASKDAALRVRGRAGYGGGGDSQPTGETPTFAITGTAAAPPPKAPRSWEMLATPMPMLQVCVLFRPFDPGTGLPFGGMESLIPSAGTDATGPEDPDAALLVAKIAETYRKAQSIDLTGEWETEQKNMFSLMEFDRVERRGLSKRSKANITLSMKRPGAVYLDLNAAWDLKPLAPDATTLKSQYRFVTDGRSEWMYWPASGVYSQSPASGRARDAFRLVLDRYADAASYPSDLRIVRRAAAGEGSGGSSNYVVLRGSGPAAGLTHEYWVQEPRHVVVSEQVRDWVGHVAAILTWKQQTLNPTVDAESFAFTPPEAAVRTADPLAPPEPQCANTFSYPALPTDTTPADFTLPDQDGKAVRFASLTGQVILTFWHTWLPRAASQLRALEQFKTGPAGRKTQVLGYTDEPPEVVRKFLRDNGLTLRTILDPDHSAKWLYPPTSRWNESFYARTPDWSGMQYAPTTVIVPPNGKSATAWSGELTAVGLERAIRISGGK
jgi:VWFA-related protein